MSPSLRVREILCLLYSGLLFICGVLLICFSVLLSYKLFYHYKFAPNGAIAPLITIFIFGFLQLALTWLGIRGPSKEHNFHIILFLVFTLVLFLAHMGVAIWCLMVRREVDYESVNLINESFGELLANNSSEKKEWTGLQARFECCGLVGPTDYLNHEDIYKKLCSEKHNIGCRQLVISYLKRIMTEAAIITFLSSLLQVIGALTFYFFMKKLKKVRQERAAHFANLRRQSGIPNSSPLVPNANPIMERH